MPLEKWLGDSLGNACSQCPARAPCLADTDGILEGSDGGFAMIMIIPQGTVRIPRHQFKNLELEEVEFPEGLQEIHAHSFRNSKLRRVIFPSTLRKIGFGAFSSCDRLEEVILPRGAVSIRPLAFSECESLKTVDNLSGKGIGERAFYEYRLRLHLCPWCGANLDDHDCCSGNCFGIDRWNGSLRLYKGLFWWNGNELITVKVHCQASGAPSYSVQFFEKRAKLESHEKEWNRLKNSGDKRIKGITDYNTIPRGRVEIDDGIVRVFLHPDLNRKDIVKSIFNEFGLSEEIQPLKEIRIINDHSAHYRIRNL